MSKMTISQALRQLAKLKGEYSRMEPRVLAAVQHKEGDEPAFPFKESLEKLLILRADILELKFKIAEANARTTITYEELGEPLILASALIAVQDLKAQISFWSTLGNHAPAKTAFTKQVVQTYTAPPVNESWVGAITQAQAAE